MKKTNSQRRLIEIFGYSPFDTSQQARKFWKLNACPFIGQACGKYDHTKTICYGTCAVSWKDSSVIICPNRLYEKDYKTIKRVANDAFGDIPFMFFQEYISRQNEDCVVALGHNSGKEVSLKNMSMDWVLAKIIDNTLIEYVGIEVQSIDITGNYRDAWYAARDGETVCPPSEHGLNWANVHKRLIPQLIRKGLIYSRSSLVKKGLYFILPDSVYTKFEEILGSDIPQVENASADTLTVHTYTLTGEPPEGEMRALEEKRTLRFELDELSMRFVSGPNLPSAEILDNKIKELLAVR